MKKDIGIEKVKNRKRERERNKRWRGIEIGGGANGDMEEEEEKREKSMGPKGWKSFPSPLFFRFVRTKRRPSIKLSRCH